jgi:hypothetical protein
MLVQLDLEEGLQVIEERSFSNCNNLEKIKFPSSLIEIGKDAFGNTALSSTLELPEGLERVGEYAFHCCIWLKSAIFPRTVTEIGRSAFSSCTALISVRLPETLQAIENAMFFNCKSLTSMRIPSNVTKFDYDKSWESAQGGVFSYCEALMSVELPKGFQSLGCLDFYRCPSLVNLCLPSSFICTTQNLDGRTFNHCTKLRTVFPADADLWNALMHRFDDLPIHELCYYHSYYDHDDLMLNLNVSIQYHSSSGTKVDAFGMTIFHILVLSSKPNLVVFRQLLQVYPVELLEKEDKWGNTTWDYLSQNNVPTFHETIDVVFQLTIMKRVEYVMLNRWRESVKTEIDALRILSPAARPGQLSIILATLGAHERLEVTSLLESILWKMNIDKFLTTRNVQNRESNRQGKRIKLKDSLSETATLSAIDRNNCRLNCGAEIVIPNVVSFLQPL